MGDMLMKKNIISAALGEEKAQLVIKNAKIVDVFCRSIIEGDIAVEDGIIVGIGSYDGENVIDADGAYVMPSFIEGHLHIESSMLAPSQFAKIIAPKGVTTVIADPHEIANVCGEDGLEYMIESAKGVPVDIKFMMPSCVPATPFENSGAVIDSAKTREIMSRHEFYGLGEMMNYPGIMMKNEDVLSKLDCADIIDGHAPSVTGKQLCTYASCGIRTDHECMSADELTEKVSRGMYVQLREGTQSQNIKALLDGVTPYTMRRLLFCTDDRYLGDVMKYGSISNCIKKAAECGLDPIDGIIMATLNAAECYKLDRLGAVAPSYRADLIISRDLTASDIVAVFKEGVKIAENGRALFDAPSADNSRVTGTVNIGTVTADMLRAEFRPDVPAIKVLAHSLYTVPSLHETADGLNMCAVLERHNKTGNIGKCFIDGFDLTGGAIAQTIGHDSHNITVLGDNYEDMAAAVNALGKNGGMAVCARGKVTYFELNIAGLMSDRGADEVLAAHEKVTAALSELSYSEGIDPFMMLSFLSLPVIPEIKLTDKGLFNVNEMRFY